MNLVTGDWIPVIYETGEHKLVSLNTLYTDAAQIRDLCATPPQRIALTRLLICITQTALDGPEDERSWHECQNCIIPVSLEYLEDHKNLFDLYGERPFLQVRALEATNNAVIDKLDFGLAAGNNAVHFDHQAAPEGRLHSPGWCALMLVTYQAFSPGGMIGETKWSGTPTGRNSEHAPCVEGSALHTLIRGQSLLTCIYLNLVTKKCIQELTALSWGRPIWETPPQSPSMKELRELTRTYLGRLVPLSRGILLEPLGTKMTLVNGLLFPKIPEARETSATVLLRKNKNDEKYSYLGTDPAKHPWRELGSLLCFSRRDVPGGALSLQHLDPNRQTTVDIWTGGLATDKGKIIDVAEWTFTVPQSVLETSTLERYEKGVDLSKKAEFHLGNAASVYCKSLKKKNTLGVKAKSHYWGKLDGDYGILLQVANEHGAGLADRWYPIVRRAMEHAYDYACPHETPRQIQAFVQGRRSLRLQKPDQ